MTQAALAAALASAGARRHVNVGDVLCHEGDASDGAFLILDAAVQAVIEVDGAAVPIEHHAPTHASPVLVGEITTLVGGQRTATVEVTRAGEIVEIDASALRDVFDAHPDAAADAMRVARERTDRTRVASLLAAELGTNDEAVLSAIAEVVTWHHLPAGEDLFAEGDDADSAYLVLGGRLSVVTAASGRVAEVGRGGVVGEFGLLEQRARAASVQALRDSDLARLSSEDFANLASRFPALAMGLIRRIVDRSGHETALGSTAARSVCVIVTAPIDTRLITTKMAQALAEIGTTAHLSPARIDALLGHEGASAVEPGAVGDVRIVELLHQVEADHEMVVFEADLGSELWTRRAIRHADHVVVVASADASEEEATAIDAVAAMLPTTTGFWLALDHPARADRPHATASIRDRHGADEVHHVRHGSTADLARIARLAVGRGIGLVLSGGGARGFAHLGVIQAMEELGIPIDRVAGASMGSVIAAIVAEDIDPGRRVDVVTAQFEDLLDYTIPIVSLVKGERITANIQDQWAGRDIEDMWIPFACVSTNLTTSEVVHHRRGPTDLAVRASVAIPGVLPPVPSGDDLLIDGGVLDNLPVDLMTDDPSIGTIIAIDVTPPLGPRARGDFGLSVSGWAALRDRVGRGKNQYPGLAAVLMRTMLVGSTRDRDRDVASGCIDCYLDLELRGVGLLEFETVVPVVERGYEASADRLREWWATTCFS